MVDSRVQPSVSSRVRLLAADHAGSYGVWERVFVCFGRSAPDITGARTFSRAARAFSAEVPSRGGFLLVLRRASTPVPEAREHAVKVFREIVEGGVQAMAVVIEADGFVAAAQRSIATAFLLTSLRDTNVKVCRRVSQASRWLAQQLYEGDPTGKAVELERGVQEFMGSEDAKDSVRQAG